MPQLLDVLFATNFYCYVACISNSIELEQLTHHAIEFRMLLSSLEQIRIMLFCITVSNRSPKKLHQSALKVLNCFDIKPR